MYSGVSLTGIPDNETPTLVIRYLDKFYPELSRYSEYYTHSGWIPDNETTYLQKQGHQFFGGQIQSTLVCWRFEVKISQLVVKSLSGLIFRIG